MKRTLLLAGAACLISLSAQAQTYPEGRAYIGVDYAYDKADFKKDFKHLDDGFNSGSVNAGVRVEDAGMEVFYQQAGSRKSHRPADEGGNQKVKFHAYGLDLMGYLPVYQNDVDLLASIGIANYDVDFKSDTFKKSKSRAGYRFGVGAQYNFTDNFSARVMGRYNYLGMRNLDSFAEVTAGVKFTF